MHIDSDVGLVCSAVNYCNYAAEVKQDDVICIAFQGRCRLNIIITHADSVGRRG